MSTPFAYQSLEQFTLQDSPTPTQYSDQAAGIPYRNRQSYHVQYWMRPIAVKDDYEDPISNSAAANMRQEVTRKLSNLPAMLHQMAVGSTWERSAEQSMREYQMLDFAAQSIDILKAMNIRDRDQILEEAGRKKDQQKSGALDGVKYWVSPQEMQKTKEGMREWRERGCRIRCLEDCMPEPMHWTDMRCSVTSDFVEVMRHIERMMDAVRATAIKLQTNSPDGRWAIKLLNFYSDGWIVWLDHFNSNVQYWNEHVWDEKVEGAKQRAKSTAEIVKEVKKKRGEQILSVCGWASVL